MIVLLSPAKSLDLSPSSQDISSEPTFVTQANKLVKTLKKLSGAEIKKLMSLSDKLAEENRLRYKSFKLRNGSANGKSALHMFAGDVYRGLGAADFNKKDHFFTQDHIRILSGLYGILRPHDQIQAYRLEMGSRLITEKGTNLYKYWGSSVTKELNKTIATSENDTVINLASNEYFKVIQPKQLKAKLLNISFKELREGELKFISFSAKVARGLMARYIVKNRIVDMEDLKGFNYEDYYFNEELSSDNNWLFIR